MGHVVALVSYFMWLDNNNSRYENTNNKKNMKSNNNTQFALQLHFGGTFCII